MVLACKYIRILMYISDNIKKVKNMDMVPFIGLIFLMIIKYKKKITINIIKENGGVGYLQDLGFINVLMVNKIIILGDSY